ncbi:DUF4335 domain-containing protein [Cyanobium sp. Morenito 9A2]|uniref:DUF4335 domain-containing protein n=1 Tax=Cyanobium sp. Morenito 9A2 TaxID=2823718 RepID=UPI0020CE0504|nr:DUF4335 domain-containing protein [Cyanobium sp. Morenito 9A2]MCP9848763.1 DUF4335 domain-containing protein [Cyanobium sp. Morenito 9A2]
MKLSYRYEQTSARLQLEGLPDVSIGQGEQVLGILTSWQLTLAGRPELEGKREHLLALIQVVLPYARHLVSDVPRAFGSATSPVAIEPKGPGHRLLLRSSQPDTEPLDLQLDDAELADLVRCLDQARLDWRVQLPLALPEAQPLKRRELLVRVPLAQRLAAPIVGAAAVALTASLALMVPPPRPTPPPGASTAPTTPAEPPANGPR